MDNYASPTRVRRSRRLLVLSVGIIIFTIGVFIVAYSYFMQANWKSVEANDVTAVNEACALRNHSDGQLYRLAYSVEGQTFYHDECVVSGAGYTGSHMVSYDPGDPYDSTIIDSDSYRYIGIGTAIIGFCVTLGVSLYMMRKIPHHHGID